MRFCHCCGQDIVDIPMELRNLPGMTMTERAILLRFVRAEAGIVTYEEFKRDFNYGRHTVQVWAMRLRKALADAQVPYKILTSHNKGFRLVKDVQRKREERCSSGREGREASGATTT